MVFPDHNPNPVIDVRLRWQGCLRFTLATMRTILLLLAILAIPLLADDKPQLDIVKVEADLKSAPNDPMLHYRKCQALFAMGKEQEAIDHAGIALTKFKEAKKDLAWMLLGSITTDDYRIDVHYNMGKRERADRKDGIVRPYSFRIWTKNADAELVRILDLELAYFEGELVSAAVGEMSADGHANLGMVDPKSDFDTIKKKVLTIIKN